MEGPREALLLTATSALNASICSMSIRAFPIDSRVVISPVSTLSSRYIRMPHALMMCVFSAFVLSGELEAAMAGIGLAAAVALDAFILRTALVPAAMHLLGKANWWLPAGLERRLPHLAVEPKEAESPVVQPPLVEGGPASVIHGFIRTADGEPVEGVEVALLSRGGRQLDRVTSLADGSYIVAVPGPGSYLLAATSASYVSRARQVVVGEGPLVFDVELAGMVEGEVDAVN